MIDATPTSSEAATHPAGTRDIVEIVARTLFERDQAKHRNSLVNTVVYGIDRKLTWDELLAGPWIESVADEYRNEAQAVLSALSQRGLVVVPREISGEMWSAGRSRYGAEAELYRAQTTDAMAQAYADQAPQNIWSAMISAAVSAGSGGDGARAGGASTKGNQ